MKRSPSKPRPVPRPQTADIVAAPVTILQYSAICVRDLNGGSDGYMFAGVTFDRPIEEILSQPEDWEVRQEGLWKPCIAVSRPVTARNVLLFYSEDQSNQIDGLRYIGPTQTTGIISGGAEWLLLDILPVTPIGL